MQGRDKAYAHKKVVVEFLLFVVHNKKKKKEKRNHRSDFSNFVIFRTNTNHKNLRAVLSILNKF